VTGFNVNIAKDRNCSGNVACQSVIGNDGERHHFYLLTFAETC